jgi:YD repeat-containing protein
LFIDDVQLERGMTPSDFTENVFQTSYSYATSDQVLSIKYPSSRFVDYEINPLIQTNKVKAMGTSIAEFTYTASSAFSTISFGNNIVVSYQYTPRDWIKSITSTGSALPAFDEYYDYYKNGNVKRISTIPGFSDQAATFWYDSYNRLAKEDDMAFYNTGTPQAISNMLYSYDKTGNRISAKEGGDSRFYGYYNNDGTINFDGNSQKSRLADDGVYSYNYDNSGNIVKKTEKSSGKYTQYFYDDDKRLIKVVLPDLRDTYYTYDYRGNLIKTESGGNVTVYFYDQESNMIEKFEYLEAPVLKQTGPVITTPPYFIVDVGVTKNVSVVGNNGNMTITGSLHTGGISSDCGENDFIVQDRSGQIVACIEDGTGDMWLKAPGNPICNIPDKNFLNAARTKSGNFIVEDSNGDVIMYIDSTGMLFLKGVLGNQERILCS